MPTTFTCVGSKRLTVSTEARYRAQRGAADTTSRTRPLRSERARSRFGALRQRRRITTGERLR